MTTADELRRAALSLPEAEERETWGHPTFRVRDKMFASLSDDGRSAGVKTTKEEQIALVAAAPETFGVPAYVGRHGWVSIELASADPGEVRELVTEAWRQTAPKRLVAAYDAEPPAVAAPEAGSPSMITLADIRSYAMALPEVVEKPHFRLPGFRVADKLLAHLEKGDEHAIVCVEEAEAKTAAADQPDVYEEVWRNGRIFVGLRVDLAKVTSKRMQELIEHAWRNRAPKRLVAEYDSR